MAGDEDAHALSADLLEDAAPYHAGDLVEQFADDAPPDERVQAPTEDARGLIDTAPGRAWQLACQAMRLLGDRPWCRCGRKCPSFWSCSGRTCPYIARQRPLRTWERPWEVTP